jgi:hypothetical protein
VRRDDPAEGGDIMTIRRRTLARLRTGHYMAKHEFTEA